MGILKHIGTVLLIGMVALSMVPAVVLAHGGVDDGDEEPVAAEESAPANLAVAGGVLAVLAIGIGGYIYLRKR